MTIKVTIPNTSYDSLTFGSGNTPTAAQVIGIDSGSSNGQLAFNTTASGTSTERMRIDNAGNVGIGTSSPAAKLDVVTTNNAARFNSSDTNGVYTTFSVNGTAKGYIGSAYQIVTGASTSDFALQATGNLLFATGGATERARIDSSGNLLVGTTAVGNYVTALTLSKDSGTNKWSVGPWASVGVDKFVIAANNTYGVYLASTSATSWSNASDERLKDIIEPISNAANKVSSLRAVIGKYKTDEKGTRRSFLIAQDVQAVLPEAVTEIPSGEYLGVSYTDTIPLLVAAIQEQQAQISSQAAVITTLTERITALENK